MASKSGHEALSSKEIEELLDTVNQTMDRLKTLYEQYFLGIQKQAPGYIHSDVERKLRELTQLNIRNTGLRYRLATLQQKFGSYNSYWRRTLRQIENGTYIRNLAKIGRQAARTGSDIPEEILAAMPKRMREQVLRDRDQAIAIAKRRNQLEEEEIARAAATPLDSAPPPRHEHKTASGAHILSEDDDDIDFDKLFAAFQDDAPDAASTQAITRQVPRADEPPKRTPPPSSTQPTTVLPRVPSDGATFRPPGSEATQPTAAVPRVPGAQPGFEPPRAPAATDTVPGVAPARPFAPAPTDTVPGVAPVRPFTPAPTDTVPGVAPASALRTPTGPIPIVTPPTPTSAIPRIPTPRIPASAQSGAIPRVPAPGQSGAIPRAPGQSGAVPRVPAPGRSGPIPKVPVPPGTQPGVGPVRAAPSQQSRPNPIAPGAAARTGAVPVASMSGPFPRPEKSGATATPPAARPQKPPLKPPPGMTEADVNALHAKYVQAKKMVGEKVDAGSREKLLRTINQTAPKVMQQYKASGVDFSVVVRDNQVVIKAKPKT